MTGYIAYTATIWHEEAPGGYWGPGLREKNMNGSVRASNSILLGHAILAYGWRAGWLTAAEKKRLSDAGLDRKELVRRVEEALAYFAAHHVSAAKPLKPTWGNTWGSSLWVAPAIEAALLVWEDLPPALRETARHMPCIEADYIASRPPKDYHPGDTGAEENGWDTHALACALVLNPHHPHAARWWETLKRYAMNTYSVKADRTDDRKVGEDRVRDLVSTANIFDDYTLENHGFFHPDYIQVSGQELGEAWMVLALGDKVVGGNWAERFEPYALHNVEPVWRHVMRSLLLPSGDFLFPNGTDWTLYTSIHPAYFAWIETTLGDPVAYVAEKRFIGSALRRHALSPPGRIFGDFHMEWWWEPLFIKRETSAMLLYALRGEPKIDAAAERKAEDVLDRGTWTRLFPDGKAWLHRNANYAASVSWGRIHVGTFTPFGPHAVDNPYMTIPLAKGVLPNDVTGLLEAGSSGDADVAVLGRKGGGKCALVCLPNSAVWLSTVPFRPLGIENDRLTTPGKTLVFADGRIQVPALKPMKPFTIHSRWVDVDGRFGLVSSGGSFKYSPAGKYNRRSVAVDGIQPRGKWDVWQMVPSMGVDGTRELASDLKASSEGDKMTVTVRDGTEGNRYRIEATLPASGKETASEKAVVPSTTARLVSVRVERVKDAGARRGSAHPHDRD